MKKLIGILTLGFLLLSSVAFAEIKIVETKKLNIHRGVVIVICIDGYQYVYIVNRYRIAIAQSFEISNGISKPTKCK